MGGEEPLRTTLRIASKVIVWTVIGAALGMLAAVTVPYLFGYRTLTVLSGSMVPTFRPGDVIVVREASPLDAHPGDIVTFRDPLAGGELVSHRVQSMQVVGSNVQFVTKGDANSGVENWTIASDGTLGIAAYKVPRIGYALSWVKGRWGRALMVVVPSLLLGAYFLVRIWRPEREPEAQEAVQ